MTQRVLVDVNIPMYAAGREHPLREPAQRTLRATARADKGFDGITRLSPTDLD